MKRPLVLVFLCAAAPAPHLEPVAPMAETRASHTATLLPDGKVLVAGGFRKAADGRTQLYSATSELYDPAARRFGPGPRLATARAGHTASLLTDGSVLVAGGWAGAAAPLVSTEIYVRGAFVPGPDLDSPRGGHTATRLADGRVLVVGGEGATTAVLYEPSARRFRPAAAPSVPRAGHTATLLPDGRVLVAGGARGRGEIEASAEIYDPAADRWTPAGSLATARYKHAAVLLADGRVLVIGGSDSSDWKGQLDSAEIYDPKVGRFAAADKLVARRFKLHEGVARLPDGRVVVAGGSRTVEIFDPATGRFSAAGTLDGEGYFDTVTALGDGGVLVAGGYDARLRSGFGAWVFR